MYNNGIMNKPEKVPVSRDDLSTIAGAIENMQQSLRLLTTSLEQIKPAGAQADGTPVSDTAAPGPSGLGPSGGSPSGGGTSAPSPEIINRKHTGSDV